jgi:hypothetical protein
MTKREVEWRRSGEECTGRSLGGRPVGDGGAVQAAEEGIKDDVRIRK